MKDSFYYLIHLKREAYNILFYIFSFKKLKKIVINFLKLFKT